MTLRLADDNVTWVETPWRHIKVGDIVKVLNDEALPADLLILKTSQDDVCFVETKNIDGETNLKHKLAISETIDLDYAAIRGMQIECELPSDKIYQFEGILRTQNGNTTPLNYENFALRGFNLRNTEYAVGVVTYVGPDTKVMMNLTIGKQKKSGLEHQTNMQILLMFSVVLVLSTASAIYVTHDTKLNESALNSYLEFYP